MKHQPIQLTVVEPGHDPLELIDMGDHVVILQKDTDTGETNSVVIGPQALDELRALAQAIGGRQ